MRTDTITVVFTDVVGSTKLASRLGPDGYEALRLRHYESLRLATSVHRGSEIKSTGDGLLIAFPSAAAALDCMIRMQQMTDATARRQGGEPKIRIGASCGEVSHDGNDIFGMSVIEAARLCAAAAPGQILVSDLLRLLTRGFDHQFVAAGEFTLKGFPEPVRAYDLVWRELDDAIPLPRKISPVSPFGVYGRADEQRIIESCWALSKQGQRQMVVLAGEPGIGKTWLAMEAGRSVHAEGGIVLFGSCDEDIGYPYRLLVEALQHYVANAPDDVLLQHVHDHQGNLLRIVPALADRVPNIPKPQVADAESERFWMFEAVTGLLGLASQQRPVLLILDDLQWAGAPELLLLKHILRATVAMQLMVIATYRDTELPRMHPLRAVLADLRREQGILGFELTVLRGLDDDGVVAFVTAVAGHALDEAQLAIAKAIGRNTEGSPLFLGEMLRNLRETGAAFCAGERWKISSDLRALGIPDGLKDIIGRRLSRLSPGTSKVLSFASVVGHEFDLTLLKQIADTSESVILDAVDEAQSAALVTQVAGDINSLSFTHMLVRATLYEDLSPARRAHMHQRVGIALEQLIAGEPDKRVDELARHWLAAAPDGDVSKAVKFARQAGDQALRGLAFEQAAEYYEQALTVLTHYRGNAEALRCDLLIALADAQRRAGNLGYRQTVAQAVAIARSLSDATRFALAVLGSARTDHPFTNSNVVDHGLIAIYEEALTKLGDKDESILRAKLLSHLAGEMLHMPERERRMELSRQAVELARASGDRSVLAQALHIYASAISDPTTLKERLALTIEQNGTADENVGREVRWAAAYQRMGTLLESGDIGGTEQMLAQMKEFALKLRQPFFNWGTELAFAMLSIMRGSPQAEEDALNACKVGKVGGQPDAENLFFAQLSVIRRDQGRHAELIEPLRKLADSLPHLPVWRVALAGLYCETDKLDEARAQIDMLASFDFQIPLSWTWPSTVINIAQVCDDLQDQKVASIYYPQLQPVSAQVGVTGLGLLCYGSLALPCGQFAACLQNGRRLRDTSRRQ